LKKQIKETYITEYSYELDYELVEDNTCVYKLTTNITEIVGADMISNSDNTTFKTNTSEGICLLDDLDKIHKGVITNTADLGEYTYFRLVDKEFFLNIKKMYIIDAIEKTNTFQHKPYTTYLENKDMSIILFSNYNHVAKYLDKTYIPLTVVFDYSRSRINSLNYDIDKVMKILNSRDDIIFKDIDNKITIIPHYNAESGCNLAVEFSWYSGDKEIFTQLMKEGALSMQEWCLENVLNLTDASRTNEEILQIEMEYDNEHQYDYTR